MFKKPPPPTPRVRRNAEACFGDMAGRVGTSWGDFSHTALRRSTGHERQEDAVEALEADQADAAAKAEDAEATTEGTEEVVGAESEDRGSPIGHIWGANQRRGGGGAAT